MNLTNLTQTPLPTLKGEFTKSGTLPMGWFTKHNVEKWLAHLRWIPGKTLIRAPSSFYYEGTVERV